MTDCDNDTVMAELFRDDPQFALGLLNDFLIDGTPADGAIVLRQIALAHGLKEVDWSAKDCAEHVFAAIGEVERCCAAGCRIGLAWSTAPSPASHHPGLIGLQSMLEEQLGPVGLRLACLPCN